MGRISTVSRAICLLGGMAAVSTFCMPSAASAQAAGRSEAVVVRPLSFVTDANLDFGMIVSAPTRGTVVVPPSGARTTTGGLTLYGTAFQPARFSGSGMRNQLVQISMGARSYAVPRVGGGAPAMTLNRFVFGSTSTATISGRPRAFRITSATGVFDFPVGATLRVGANQPAGEYSTTFSITLVYQ
jgi:hypothetical protein